MRTGQRLSIARVTTLVFFGLFGVFLALTVLLPSTEAQPVLGLVGRVAQWLSPFGFSQSVRESFVEFSANVVLFAPFGFFISLLWPSLAGWRVILIGTIVSGCVETAQWWIPGRATDLRDVLSNTLGTALGVVLVFLIRRITEGRQSRRNLTT